jgi:hypothetical protein
MSRRPSPDRLRLRLSEERTTGAGLANAFFHRPLGGSMICRRPVRPVAFPAPPRQQCGARHISQSCSESGDRDESALRRALPHREKNLAPAIAPRKAPTPTIVPFTMMAGASAAMAALESEIPLTPLPECIKRGFDDANERESRRLCTERRECRVGRARSRRKYSMAQECRPRRFRAEFGGKSDVGSRRRRRAQSHGRRRQSCPFRLEGMIARSVALGKSSRRRG